MECRREEMRWSKKKSVHQNVSRRRRRKTTVCDKYNSHRTYSKGMFLYWNEKRASEAGWRVLKMYVMFESLQNVKRYQPQNVVYLLCVNWSHWKVIKNKMKSFNRYPKHTHLTSIDEFRKEALLENRKTPNTAQRPYERKKKSNICIRKVNTCKRFESLSSCIYYKAIDKFACRTDTTSYTK